jgi:hypothetical protein
MKTIFTQKVKSILTAAVILTVIVAGIMYTWHMYSTGQFGQ